MAEATSAKPKCLSERDARICKENGIATDHVSVINRTDSRIVLINHRTRDEIWIEKGERKWL